MGILRRGGLAVEAGFAPNGWRLTKKEELMTTQIQYVSDETGQTIGVIVPIELWHEIESELETAYLLRSPTMK